MIVKFFDRQRRENPLNAEEFGDSDSLIRALQSMKDREPFFCELDGENEYRLLIGLGNPWSCAQYSKMDGEPPYLMALAEGASLDGDDLEFLINDTATPVCFRYALGQNTLWEVVRVFVEAGKPSPKVQWKEI